MSQETSLTVVEQREIVFYGDNIVAVRLENNEVFVPLRPICELIGVAWQPQARKLSDDPVLSQVSMSVTIRLQTSSGSTRPLTAQMLCVPLDYLNGWLFGINANRVKEEIRPKLIQYQKDVYKVLAEAFLRNKITARPLAGDIEELLTNSDEPSAVAYRHAMAIANLAREQVLLKLQFDNRLESVETRLGLIETKLGQPERMLTPEQAMHLSQAVKSVAFALGARSGRNEFQGVYGELYRRFKVPSYRELPASQFDEAMSFLRQWFSSLSTDDVPF